MGQYYRPCLEQEGVLTVFNRDVDGEYTMAKLTEHSWWQNTCMNAISEKIYQKPSRLIWCGDYAEDDELLNENSSADQNSYPTTSFIWDGDGEGLTSTEFTIDNLYLCNHDTKEYIDLNEYKQKSIDKDDWCLHPLSLLTAVGNGKGGGDYHECHPNFDEIGIWRWCLISLEETIPEGYEKYDVYFKED